MTLPSDLYAAVGTFGAPGELYILDPTNGQPIQDIGPTNDADGNNHSIAGLAYHVAQRTLYAITPAQSPAAPSCLLKIDPLTAQVKEIIGPLGSRLTDIAYDPITESIYGVSSSRDLFYKLDLTTGEAEWVGKTGIPPQNGGSLSTNAAGEIFGISLSGKVPVVTNTLYRYDKTTGKATAIGFTGSVLFVRSLAFSVDGLLYGIEGGSLRSPKAARNFVLIDPVTGISSIIGQTINRLDALAYVPTMPSATSSE